MFLTHYSKTLNDKIKGCTQELTKKVQIIINYKCQQQIHLNTLSVFHHSGTTVVIK